MIDRRVTLLLFLCLTVGGGLAIGYLTAPGDWYAQLRKPVFNPPGWIFGPVWTVLYVVIGVVGWRLWQRDRGGRPMQLWWLQLVLNFSWTPIFFALHRIDLALAVAVFAVVLRKSPYERTMTLAALVLAVATLLFSGWSVWMDAVDARSSNPFPSAHRDAQIVQEFLLPSLVGLVMLWRMLVRSHRIAIGRDPRTRWPWITMCVGLALVFNPLGIELIGSALAPSGSDWLAGLWRIVVAVAAAVIAVLGIIEYALRARRLRLPVQAEV